MVAERETELYRRTKQGGGLSPAEREELARPYLPPAPSVRFDRKDTQRSSSSASSQGLLGVRAFLLKQIHVLIFTVIHTLFSVYIRLRQAYNATLDRIFAILYYHHRTPELIKRDVQSLGRLPEHLSVILSFDDDVGPAGEQQQPQPQQRRRRAAGDHGVVGPAELEALMDDVAEISAWCACAGIPMLSVYESTGRLKRYLPAISHAVSAKLRAYFGSKHPSLQLSAPHMGTLVNGEPLEQKLSASGEPTSEAALGPDPDLFLLLISAEDGRDSVVDLTKTLAEMSQRGKLSPSEINLPLVDAELVENVMDEPDLLILFDSAVQLRSYPPWQLRLTEIFHVQDNQGVGYQVFLRGLYSFAKAQMRFGR